MTPQPPLEITERFATTLEHLSAGGQTWSLLVVEDTNVLVDAITPERFAGDERLPYWAELWTSAIALARALRTNADLKGKSLLDLGCGLGLTGIAAAQAGAHVTMTDYDDDALLFARWNLRSNLTPSELSRVEVRKLDWRQPEGLGRFDMILRHCGRISRRRVHLPAPFRTTQAWEWYRSSL